MKIVDVTVESFRYISNTTRDSEGHGHPGPEQEASQSLTTIITDEGVKGYCFGAIPKATLENLVKPILVGKEPHYREQIWHALKERQRLNLATLSNTACKAATVSARNRLFTCRVDLQQYQLIALAQH